MRALITGATGFVGSTLTQYLLEKGWDVYALVRHNSLFSTGRLSPKTKIVKGDVTSLSDMINAVRESQPDVVFHLAAQSYVPLSFSDPSYTIDVNVNGTLNLLEAVRLLNVDAKIIFAGSSEEYGIQFISDRHYFAEVSKRNIFPPPNRLPEVPINEHNPLRPRSPYAASKVMAEYLMRTYYTVYGIKTVVSRAFNHEGPGRGHNFVTSVIARQAAEMKFGLRRSMVLGNVNAFRDWSHVADIVRAYEVLALKGKPGEVYVVGSNRTNSVLTFALLALDYALGGIDEIVVKRNGENVIAISNPLDKYLNPLANGGEYFSHVDKILMDHLMEGDELIKPNDVVRVLKNGSEIAYIVISPDRYRPSEVPILMSSPAKIAELGWKHEKSLKDIVEDMVTYYYDKKNRENIVD